MNIHENIKTRFGIDINTLEIFIINDQTAICSKCHSRTNLLNEFPYKSYITQLCQCPNKKCKFIFLEQEDDYFSINYWLDESRLNNQNFLDERRSKALD